MRCARPYCTMESERPELRFCSVHAHMEDPADAAHSLLMDQLKKTIEERDESRASHIETARMLQMYAQRLAHLKRRLRKSRVLTAVVLKGSKRP